MLDTNDLDKHEAGSVGRIGRDQMTWLGNVLRCVERQHPKDLVLAFGHHGLRDTRSAGESIEHALASSKNVIGYFYGHDHVHGICRPKGSCTHFWEVMTASVIEYPQEARLVRIKYAGAGLGFLEVTTFGERNQNGGDAFARAVELGHRGAERDWCNSGQAQMCSEDKRVYRDDARHTNARLFFRLPEYRSDCCDVLPGT